MVTEPKHQRPDDAGIPGPEPHLESVRFRREACLMHEGSPGDACYFIVSGEVRVEVERPDFDTDGVVSFMGPGAVCGEFGLLDGSPRSASVYAHTDVVARRMSADALRELCDRDPAAGIRMLRWLSRSAAGKARALSKNLEEFILAGEPDPAMDALVARSAAAQESIALARGQDRRPHHRAGRPDRGPRGRTRRGDRCRDRHRLRGGQDG